MKTAVEPVEFVIRHTITDIEIMISHIILFKSVQVLVKLYDEDKLIDSRLVLFEDDDYKRWLVDDDLVKLTLEHLGLTAVVPVPEQVTSEEIRPEEIISEEISNEL